MDAQQWTDRLLPLHQPPASPGWNRAILDEMGIRPPTRRAAVLLAIHEGKEGPGLLFTRRTDDLSHHPGQVSFPGGGEEPGDRDAVAAALREAQEEIALPPDMVEPLGYLDALDTTSGFCITPVVAQVHGQPRLAAQPDEVAELFSVPLAYLLDRDHYGHREVNTPVGVRSISEIHYRGHVIWGATAMILTNLLQRLDGEN